MRTKHYIVGLGLLGSLSAAIALGMMVATNPAAIGPVMVTVWFVVVIVAIASLVSLGLYGAKSFFKIHSDPRRRLRYSWRQGWLVAIGATALLGLASLGQFGIRDALLLGLLLSITEVYVRFRWP